MQASTSALVPGFSQSRKISRCLDVFRIVDFRFSNAQTLRSRLSLWVAHCTSRKSSAKTARCSKEIGVGRWPLRTRRYDSRLRIETEFCNRMLIFKYQQFLCIKKICTRFQCSRIKMRSFRIISQAFGEFSGFCK